MIVSHTHTLSFTLSSENWCTWNSFFHLIAVEILSKLFGCDSIDYHGMAWRYSLLYSSLSFSLYVLCVCVFSNKSLFYVFSLYRSVFLSSSSCIYFYMSLYALPSMRYMRIDVMFSIPTSSASRPHVISDLVTWVLSGSWSLLWLARGRCHGYRCMLGICPLTLLIRLFSFSLFFFSIVSSACNFLLHSSSYLTLVSFLKINACIAQTFRAAISKLSLYIWISNWCFFSFAFLQFFSYTFCNDAWRRWRQSESWYPNSNKSRSLSHASDRVSKMMPLIVGIMVTK